MSCIFLFMFLFPEILVSYYRKNLYNFVLVNNFKIAWNTGH